MFQSKQCLPSAAPHAVSPSLGSVVAHARCDVIRGPLALVRYAGQYAISSWDGGRGEGEEEGEEGRGGRRGRGRKGRGWGGERWEDEEGREGVGGGGGEGTGWVGGFRTQTVFCDSVAVMKSENVIGPSFPAEDLV